jgi:hypothetical protein
MDFGSESRARSADIFNCDQIKSVPWTIIDAQNQGQ